MLPRIKASLLHLSGSIVLALLAVALVFFVWYPAPLNKAVGVSHIFLLMLGIDVVLGPLLTLVVYKTDFRQLRIDLGIIIIVQLAMFGYGMYTIAIGRPAWIAYSVDSFVLVRAAELDTRKSAEAAPEYRHAPWFGPGWVAANAPTDIAAKNEIQSEVLRGGPDLPARPNLYHPLNTDVVQMRQNAKALPALKAFNAAALVDQITARYPAANAWLPLHAPEQDMTVLINSASGAVVAVVDLRPWK